MRIDVVRAENGYVVEIVNDPGSFGKRFIAKDLAEVSDIIVAQLAAAELDRQDYKNTVDKYGAVGGVAANIQKPLWNQGLVNKFAAEVMKPPTGFDTLTEGV